MMRVSSKPFCGTERFSVADRSQLVGVNARLALSGLDDVIGQFRQGLGLSNDNSAGYTGPLEDTGANLAGAVYQITPDAIDADKRLIDGVNLLGRTQTRCQTHHAVADVTVRGKISRQGHPFLWCSCLTVKSPSTMATTMWLCRGLMALATNKISLSKVPALTLPRTPSASSGRLDARVGWSSGVLLKL